MTAITAIQYGGQANGWTAHKSWLNFQHQQEIFLMPKTILDLGAYQSPIQGILARLSPGHK